MSDMFDVSKTTSSMKSMLSKNSNYIKGVFNAKNSNLSPVLVYTLRVTLVVVLLSLFYMGLPLPVTQAMDNLLVRVLLVVTLIFLTMVEPVSAVLLLALFMVMYYKKEQMKMRLNTLKHESFRGGLQAYAGIGADSNEHLLSDETKVDFVKANIEAELPSEMNTEMSTFSPTTAFVSPVSTCASNGNNTVTFAPGTMSQFDRIQNNIVGDEDSMNTEVRTWVDEAGPQGMSYPTGFPLDNTTAMDTIGMLTPF